jgi:DNA-binding transcriptional MerR regulator
VVAIEKLYYTISEVAEQLRLNQSVLRYWESEFNHIQPRKTKKGDRLYTQKDIDDLRMIFHLLKEKGFTIEGAKKFLKENKAPNTSLHVLQSLSKIKHQLEQLKNNL